MENASKSVALDSLNKAEEYKLAKNFGRSFAHYLVYIQLCPNERAKHERSFTEVLCSWGIDLENRNQTEDLYNCYMLALQQFPSSVQILHNFGAHLLRQDNAEAAKPYFELAYNIDRNFLPVQKGLDDTFRRLIPSWHIYMLNDFERNNTYRIAIERKVSRLNNCNVIDIGAGSGILSLYAASCSNVKQVLAIEESKHLAETLGDILNENAIKNITVINSNSNDINVADVGLSNLLITEIFDVGLFGEHVLETLIHAWENLLEPNSQVIPSSANLFITGINSDIIKCHKCCNSLDVLNLNNVCIVQDTDEPYESKNLRNKSVSYLTDVQNALTVNFTNVQELRKLYTDKNSIPSVVLKMLQPGTLNAFAIWFDLHLDEDVTISTSPFKSNVKAWNQAVIYLNHPLTLQTGDEIKLQLSCVENRLEVEILDPVVKCPRCFHVSSEVISLLNDTTLITTVTKVTENFDDYNLDVLDLLPFPIFGLLMAKKGSRAYCTATCDHDRGFIEHVATLNNCKNNLIVIDGSEIDSFVSNSMYDVIFIEPISKHGLVHENNIRNIANFRSCLKPNGIIIPESVVLMFNLIESDYLDQVSRVSDKSVGGFKIAKHFNKYAVLEYWCIRAATLPHKDLSGPIMATNILDCEDDPREWSRTITMRDSGRGNAIVYWFNINFTKDVTVSTQCDTHYYNASFILEEPMAVNVNDNITAYVKQHNGLLKIYCSK